MQSMFYQSLLYIFHAHLIFLVRKYGEIKHCGIETFSIGYELFIHRITIYRQVFFLLKLFSVLKVFFQSQERNSSFIVLFSSFIMRRWNIYFLLLRRKNNFLQKRRFWEENLISPNKLPILSDRSYSHGHSLSYGYLIGPT